MNQEKSKVFFIDYRQENDQGERFDLIHQFINFAASDVIPKINKSSTIAVKVHFGELGNKTFVHPDYVHEICQYFYPITNRIFLTDCNTMYVGSRSHGVEHIQCANFNGFQFDKIPIIIADGIFGNNYEEVNILNSKHGQTVYIGKEIYDSDFLVCISHFKGHELSCFGGAIKNLGMGCASKKGKIRQHSDLGVFVNDEKCTGCGTCKKWCINHAPMIINKKMHIDKDRCINCGNCIVPCPSNAIDVNWSDDIPSFQEKMVEYSKGAIQNKEGKCIFINFLLNITPQCDCYPFSGQKVIDDIGILFSVDPVAIDRASMDLLEKYSDDHFNPLEKLYPNINWRGQLNYAQKHGVGNNEYKLISQVDIKNSFPLNKKEQDEVIQTFILASIPGWLFHTLRDGEAIKKLIVIDSNELAQIHNDIILKQASTITGHAFCYSFLIAMILRHNNSVQNIYTINVKLQELAWTKDLLKYVREFNESN